MKLRTGGPLRPQLSNACALLLLAACTGPAEPSPPEDPAAEAPRPSLVLVTLDTTRADHIGAYGYALAATPTIDQLAREGLRFERAYATVPLTTPAHASMLTGLYPTRHGIHSNGDATLPEELDTLAEALQARGWATGASVAAFVTTRIWNLDQGFDDYFDEVPPQSEVGTRWARERPADEVVDDALAWLESLPPEQPFFLWVHVYDPHHPYQPPEDIAARMPGRPYDGELAFVDSQLARLRPAVEARAGEAGAAWIVLGDHGEVLREDRGERTHGLFLFDETTHVPFIVRPAKGLPEARVAAAPTVSVVDVAPTALGLLGLPVFRDVDGVDLSPLLRGEAVERPGVYLESLTAAQRFGFAPERAVAEGPWKLMATPNPRLFHVGEDPGEQTNRYVDEPAQVARLQAQLDAVLAAEVDRTQAAISAEVIDQLAALGYLGAGEAADLDSQVDAKDQTDTLRLLEKARFLSRAPETRDEAEALYREILAAQPVLKEARAGLSRLLEDSGRLVEAEALLREAGEPDSTVAHMNLARLLGKQQRFEESVLELEAVLAMVPGDEQAQAGLLRTLPAAGRTQEALERGRVWVEAAPDSTLLHAQLGILLARIGEAAEADSHLQASLADGVDRPCVKEGLALVALSRGDEARAILLLEAELALFPKNPDARRALGGLYMGAARWSDAAAVFEVLARNNAKDLDARRTWAQAVFNTGDYAEAERILAEALVRAPDDPHVMMLQANILAKTGRREEGEALQARAKERWEALGRPAPR
ncbi:MAG: sulfatase-like hydrolase/transferase [Alphaproteobacteria bacterium]|nr:sulfatase-like hydrolase/transferase [Alphaproteobacteria bacterium]MCB9796129.1 sulfatase-like hydrolase/transferase [Alphaproteobacteria bacterium]